MNSASDNPSWLADRLSFLRPLLLALVAIGFTAAAALASGETFSLVGHDLQVDVDSRWVGCGQGGYCPVRVRVVNRGPARRLTFRIAKSPYPLVAVRQTLDVPQNATLGLTLSVPMVNTTANGEFRIADDNGDLQNMRHSVSFPEINQWEAGRLGLLVVAGSVVDLQPFEDAATTYRLTNGGITSFASAPVYSGRAANSIWLQKNALPTSWVDFSGLDLLAVPLDELEKIPKGTRAALMQWTRCGGTLLVTSVGEMSATNDKLAKILVGDTALASAWAWTEPKFDDRHILEIIHQDASSNTVTVTKPPENAPGEWSREAAPFRMADVGFGKLIAFAGEPFPGTAQDWFWLLKSCGGAVPPRWDWGKRHGESARQGNSEFLWFVIPGIGGVPVVMFLILITIFAVVIGPLNYFVLARRKQLHLLLLTIPAMAFITSLLLFGYTVVAHGFSVKARCRSLTYVDQAAQSAVTINRLSLYAGQAPSAGMQFSRDTAVYPIWPENTVFESGQLDWTNTQNLTSGWLRSRTRTQFLTVGHRTERGRLEVTASSPDKLTVANGFEWGFAPLVVVNDQGRMFVGKNVAAGDSIDLQPATSEELKEVQTALQRFPLELPIGMTGDKSSWGLVPSAPLNHFWHQRDSLMEQAWTQLNYGAVAPGGLSTDNSPVPRTFFGVTTQSPRIELGVSKATETHSVHTVMGRW